jgi:hypothetical protein
MTIGSQGALPGGSSVNIKLCREIFKSLLAEIHKAKILDI